jgi:hypothetical protein
MRCRGVAAGEKIACDLGHRHVGATVARLQHYLYLRGTEWARTRAENEPVRRIDLQDFGVILHRQRPRRGLGHGELRFGRRHAYALPGVGGRQPRA